MSRKDARSLLFEKSCFYYKLASNGVTLRDLQHYRERWVRKSQPGRCVPQRPIITESKVTRELFHSLIVSDGSEDKLRCWRSYEALPVGGESTRRRGEAVVSPSCGVCSSAALNQIVFNRYVSRVGVCCFMGYAISAFLNLALHDTLRLPY